MRVLVGCEFSGTVRDAFRGAGHDAMSCDLLPSLKPGPHYQGDIRDVLADGWDLAVFHPPCTYLSVSGLFRNLRDPVRAEKTEAALEFVRLLLAAPIPRIALENPVSCISSRIRKPDQTIQPYEFGHDASKRTCLWLKGLRAAGEIAGAAAGRTAGVHRRARLGRAVGQSDGCRTKPAGSK